jgi:hypothetical protein
VSESIGRVFVVIRSVGERTEAACRELVLAQGVPEHDVTVISDSPFARTLRKGLEAGLERALDWTLCVDADVLMRPGAIDGLFRIATAQPAAVCEVQGLVLDKMFGGPRAAGNHMYRTRHIPLVLDVVSDDSLHIRPETQALMEMAERGHPWLQVDYVVGLHDFEQWHRDIFRKCFIYAHKHLEYAHVFLPLWRQGPPTDADYRSAVSGFVAGLAYEGAVVVDAGLAAAGGTAPHPEKDALSPREYTLEVVADRIMTWAEPTWYLRTFPFYRNARVTEPDALLGGGGERRFGRLRNILRTLGPLRALEYGAGRALEKVGGRLVDFAQRVAPDRGDGTEL